MVILGSENGRLVVTMPARVTPNAGVMSGLSGGMVSRAMGKESMGTKDEKRRTNNVSPEGRARQAIAGTKNMLEWHRSGVVRMVAAENQDAVERAETLIEKTVAELGGETKLSATQASLIESQRTCLLVLTLAQARLMRKGVLIRSSNKPDELLDVIATYSVLVRKNLEALGIPKDDESNAPANGEPETSADRVTRRWLEQREQQDAQHALAAEIGNDHDS
jgi:hypothetical protein